MNYPNANANANLLIDPLVTIQNVLCPQLRSPQEVHRCNQRLQVALADKRRKALEDAHEAMTRSVAMQRSLLLPEEPHHNSEGNAANFTQQWLQQQLTRLEDDIDEDGCTMSNLKGGPAVRAATRSSVSDDCCSSEEEEDHGHQ